MKERPNDQSIDEIRELRRRISARLVAYYMKLQEQYRDRLIDTANSTEQSDHATE